MLFYKSKFVISVLEIVRFINLLCMVVLVHCSVQVLATQFSSGPSQEYDKPVLKTSIPGPRSKVTSKIQ